MSVYLRTTPIQRIQQSPHMLVTFVLLHLTNQEQLEESLLTIATREKEQLGERSWYISSRFLLTNPRTPGRRSLRLVSQFI